MKICVDKNSTIALAKNPMSYNRSKHIDTRFHFIREHVKNKEIELIFVKSQDQTTDIFVKPRKSDIYNKLRTSLGIMDNTKIKFKGGS